MSATLTRRASDQSKVRRSGPRLRHQAAGDFTFINLSEPKQSKDESLRRFVRSNAMRNYRQKEKQKAIITEPQEASLKFGGTAYPHLSRTVKLHNEEPIDWEASVTETHILLQPASQQLEMRDTQGEECSPISGCGHSCCNDTGCNSCLPLQGSAMINPSRLIGDDMSNPFNVYPSGGSPRYNSYLLNHCEKFISQTFPRLASPPLILHYNSRLCHGAHLPSR